MAVHTDMHVFSRILQAQLSILTPDVRLEQTYHTKGLEQ